MGGLLVLVSPSATAHTYICIMLRQAGLLWEQRETALHCLYLIAWPPAVTAYIIIRRCMYSQSVFHHPVWKPNMSGAPWRRGKWPVHLPWKGATVNLYQSVNQSGTVGMNPGVLSPRVLLDSESGFRAVFQLPRCVRLDGRMREWWKPLSDVKWATSGKEGASYSERISCKSHKSTQCTSVG